MSHHTITPAIELAIDRDRREDITDVAEKAVRWMCYGEEQNAAVESAVAP